MGKVGTSLNCCFCVLPTALSLLARLLATCRIINYKRKNIRSKSTCLKGKINSTFFQTRKSVGSAPPVNIDVSIVCLTRDIDKIHGKILRHTKHTSSMVPLKNVVFSFPIYMTKLSLAARVV